MPSIYAWKLQKQESPWNFWSRLKILGVYCVFKLKTITKVGRVLYPSVEIHCLILCEITAANMYLKYWLTIAAFRRILKVAFQWIWWFCNEFFNDNLLGNFEWKITIFAHNVWIWLSKEKLWLLQLLITLQLDF